MRMRTAWLLLVTGCVPAPDPTTQSEPVAYVARPLQPSNCGTPDEPASCKQRKQPQREQEGRIIWNPGAILSDHPGTAAGPHAAYATELAGRVREETR
jgi:hypothetical protein